MSKMSLDFPLLLSPTAMVGFMHKDGEKNLVKAAFNKGIVYILPTMASKSLDSMIGVSQPNQPLM